jgi:hypothetical protein
VVYESDWSLLCGSAVAAAAAARHRAASGATTLMTPRV